MYSWGGACYASSHTGLHTECIHDDCHPMSGMDKSLEQFMKMEEEFISSVKCFGNHLDDLEKLDMRLSAQESYIRSIRLKLQGLIHVSAGVSNGYAGMPNIQNNLNSQTVINNQTTMNANNTCINNNFMQNNFGQASTYDVCTSDNVTYKQHGIAQVDAKDAEINDLKKNKPSGLSEEDKGFNKWIWSTTKSAELREAIQSKYDFVKDPTIILKPYKKKK